MVIIPVAEQVAKVFQLCHLVAQFMATSFKCVLPRLGRLCNNGINNAEMMILLTIMSS
jgi:hypothetical protein